MRLIRRLQAYLEYLVHTAGVASGELRTQLGIKSLRALLVARVVSVVSVGKKKGLLTV